MADPKIMEALEQLLTRGVEASQQEGRKTRLDELKETDPGEWTDEQWDFANERGLIPPDKQGEYEYRLLEKRQAAERAQLGAWQGGNLPTTGTATLGVHSTGIPQVPVNPVAASLGMKIEEVEDPEEAPSEQDDETPYDQRNYQDLKKLAKSRGLDTSGSQEDLVERLRLDDQSS